jgi:hypothetical protein
LDLFNRMTGHRTHSSTFQPSSKLVSAAQTKAKKFEYELTPGRNAKSAAENIALID